jgi:hypothetical protein
MAPKRKRTDDSTPSTKKTKGKAAVADNVSSQNFLSHSVFDDCNETKAKDTDPQKSKKENLVIPPDEYSPYKDGRLSEAVESKEICSLNDGCRYS